MIPRRELESAARWALRRYPVVALVGPRQCGKTTLGRALAARGRGHYFDLERGPDFDRLANALLALERLRGLIVLDEVQRRPELFETLRVLADRRPLPARFLLLGSVSPYLVRGVSETLAGRIRFIEMGGFHLGEAGADRADRLWIRGGFPRSFLAGSEKGSYEWREDFIATFLERDVPRLGFSIPAETLRRFWYMVAHYHGQVWNAAEFARSLGASEPTARRYLDLLAGAYLVRPLEPWFENLAKRQVKSPKVYFRDSGLLHAMLGIRTREDLERHPKVGASWEGFCIENVISRVGARASECHFWATHQGAELDLLVVRGRRRLGFEVKFTDSPKVTPSMRIAMQDLGLDRLDVIHGGRQTFPLARDIRALALRDLRREVSPLP